jgi:pentatricopeptide repeat protein
MAQADAQEVGTMAAQTDDQSPCGPQGGHEETLATVETLAEQSDVEQALELLKGLPTGEVPAATLNKGYAKVIEAFVRLGRINEAADLTISSLAPTGCDGPQPLAQSVELVLKNLLQEHGNHLRVVQLLRAACAAGSPPGDAAFNEAVDSAVRARAYGEAWDILDLLLASQRRADKYFVSILTKSLESLGDSVGDRRTVKRGITLVERFIAQQQNDVDEIVFNSLLNVLGNNGDMAKVQQTLGKMGEYNVLPSAVTYGTVVKAYGRAKDINSVLRVWAEMRQRCLGGVNPVTCGCVLDACVKCGHLDRAMQIFQEMRCAGLHKNTVLYATLIKGLAKTRDLVSAVTLYQEMRFENVPCNLVTFNSLMDVCVRCGDLQTAALFLQDMMHMGIEPDLITFSTLIKGYSQTGEVHKALALRNELKTRGLRCDEIMFNSLIDGCAKASNLKEGLRVFNDMLQSRVSPSNITFSILVKLYFEANMTAEAFAVVEEMGSRYHCSPNRIVYIALFRGAAQQGGAALERGAGLLSELLSGRKGSGGKSVVDQNMVSEVIGGCLRHGDFQLAVNLVKEYVGNGGRRGNSMVPAECMRSVAEALGAAGNDALKQDLYDTLRQRNFPSNQLAQFQAAFTEGSKRLSVGGGNGTGAGDFAASNATSGNAHHHQSHMPGYSAAASWYDYSAAAAGNGSSYVNQCLPPYVPGTGLDFYHHGAQAYADAYMYSPAAAAAAAVAAAGYYSSDAYGAVAAAAAATNSVPHYVAAGVATEPAGTDASARSPPMVAAPLNMAPASTKENVAPAKENVAPAKENKSSASAGGKQQQQAKRGGSAKVTEVHPPGIEQQRLGHLGA